MHDKLKVIKSFYHLIYLIMQLILLALPDLFFIKKKGRKCRNRQIWSEIYGKIKMQASSIFRDRQFVLLKDSGWLFAFILALHSQASLLLNLLIRLIVTIFSHHKHCCCLKYWHLRTPSGPLYQSVFTCTVTKSFNSIYCSRDIQLNYFYLFPMLSIND